MAGEIKPIFDDEAVKQLATVNQYIDDIKGAIIELNKLKVEMKSFKDYSENAKKSKDVTDEIEKAEKKLAEAQTQRGKELVKLRAETARANAETRRQAKAVKDGTIEYTKARDELIKLQNAAKEVGKTKGILSKEFQEASEKANKLATELNEIDKATGDYRSTVGRYREEVTKAIKDTGAFGGTINNITNVFNSYTKIKNEVTKSLQVYIIQQNVAKGATDANTTALQRLRIALIATGIGAFVVLLGTLVAAFLSTQRGVDALNRVLEPLKAILQSTWGVVQDLATSIVDAFSNPKQAIQDLGELVKTQLINRFQAFKRVVQAILKLDFKEAGKNLVDVYTGIENTTEKTSKFFGDAAAKGAEIFKLKKEIEEIEKEQALNQEKRNREETKLQQIVRNTGLSLKEREDAMNKILKLTEEEAAEVGSIVEKNAKILEIRQSMNDTQRTGVGSEEELNKLLAEQLKIEGKIEDKKLEFTRVISQITKDENARAKERNDIEAQRLAKIQELARTELEALDFKRNKQIEELKLNKEISELTDDELKALTKINDEYNKQVELLTKKTEMSVIATVQGLQSEQKQLQANIKTLEAYRDAASPENQEAINKELEFYAEKLGEVEGKLISLGGLLPEFYNAQERLKEVAVELRENYEKQYEALQKQYEETGNAEEYYRKLEALQNAYSDDVIAKTAETIEEILEKENLSVEERASLEEQLFQIRKKYYADTVADHKAHLEKIDADALASKERRTQIAFAALEGIQNAANLVSTEMIARGSAELEAFKEQKRQELDYQNELLESGAITQEEYLARKTRLENEVARKEAEQKRKAAIADKVNALFGIALSTAQAAMAALARTPLPLGAPFLAATIATGALQAGLVASRPIPKFAKGVENFSGGMAEIGEAGRELVRLPSGDTFLTPERMITWLPKGTDVIPNKKTEQIIKDRSVPYLKDISRKLGKLQSSTNIKIVGGGYADWYTKTTKA